MKKLKVGIIGSGFGLNCHFPSFRQNKNCNVLALCTKNAIKGKKLAKKNGIKNYFNNWKLMIKSIDLDIISIAVPPKDQPKIVKFCLSKSIPVLAEKPLSISLSDSKQIYLKQKKNKIPGLIDFIFPEIDIWKKTREIIQKRKFGSVKNLSVDLNFQSYTNMKKISSWKNNINMGGGILHHFLPHIFYYLEWFCGTISSISVKLNKEKNYKFTGHTKAIILLKFSSGTTGIIRASSNNYGVHEHVLKFINDRGTIILENRKNDWVKDFKLQTIDNKKKKNINVKYKNKKKTDSRIYPVSKIVNKLVNWVIYKKKESPNFKSAVRVQYLIEKSLLSNKLKGRWVSAKNFT